MNFMNIEWDFFLWNELGVVTFIPDISSLFNLLLTLEYQIHKQTIQN